MIAFLANKGNIYNIKIYVSGAMQMQIYFMSITQGVIAHSPEPEAHEQGVCPIELEFRG